MSLFLVRVWQRDGGFHASVRGVGQEVPVHFEEAHPLAEFLAKAAPAQPVAVPAAPAVPPLATERHAAAYVGDAEPCLVREGLTGR